MVQRDEFPNTADTGDDHRIFGNRWMRLAIGVTALLQLCAISVPFLQSTLNTVALEWQHRVMIVLAGLPVFLAGEMVK